MSEAKFTRGNWVISSDKIGIRDKSDSQSFGMIMEVCWIEEIFYSSEESKANAHLIAAAPEMYEMLNELTSMNSEDAKLFIENSDSIIELLAKARGETK